MIPGWIVSIYLIYFKIQMTKYFISYSYCYDFHYNINMLTRRKRYIF